MAETTVYCPTCRTACFTHPDGTLLVQAEMLAAEFRRDLEVVRQMARRSDAHPDIDIGAYVDKALAVNPPASLEDGV